MQDNPLLNNIAFDLVKNKAIEDRTKEIMEEQKHQKEAAKQQAKMDKEDKEPDLDEIDSEEERIMQRELEKRQGIASKKKAALKKRLEAKYGQYRDIIETEFLDTMLKNNKVVCHFYHNDFERCKIMDKHLKIIAEQHPETLFVRINADKTPFFTVKLGIKVLPTVILFVDGKALERIIGFEELGMKDDFPTINLTRKLVKAKMIEPRNKSERGEVTITKGKYKEDEEDDDDDLDY